MIPNWLDSYYEALEFFYWEPQHLGLKKNIASELDTVHKVVKHLCRMEVTLNHNINQFLLLAPVAFRSRFFQELFGRTFDSQFEMHGRGVDTDFALENAVQPDFLFISDTDVISIEMKINAKSSIEQVLKYALLGLAVEMRLHSPRRHCLGFLGVRDFSKQWQERFASPAELRCALDTKSLATFLQRQPAIFRAHQDRFKTIVAELGLSFISYRKFADLLKSEVHMLGHTTPEAEVYRNLLSGLLCEFERRELCG